MALVDAVYSKQMRYTTTRGKGLLPRLLVFKEKYPRAGVVDLRELLELSEADLQDVLGHGVTNGRTKAFAVLEAARNLVQLGVSTHEEYNHQNQEQTTDGGHLSVLRQQWVS